jgi:transcriptional regulator with PAS, ATPase and Fis domain
MTKAYEKAVINSKIQELGGDLDSKKEAAKQLGISIATLYRKLEMP